MAKHSSATLLPHGMPSPDGVETPRERFHRLAPKRVDLALHRLKLVGNLAGPAYECTADEADKIMGAIDGGIVELRRKFLDKFEKPVSKGFSFHKE